MIALAARVKHPGEEFVGDQRELMLLNAQPNEEQPYERLLGDALAGAGALFTREDAVEAAWAVVDPVLENHDLPFLTLPAVGDRSRQTSLVAHHGRWHNPVADRQPSEVTP